MSPIQATIQAPPLIPGRYGLFQSAPVSVDNDERWFNGFTWDPESCGDAHIFPICDPASELSKEIGDEDTDNPSYMPFTVWAGDKCTTLDNNRDRQARAQRKLEACRSRVIEHELWTGEQAQALGLPNQYLASPDTEVLADGAPIALLDAIAGLEEARARCACGGRGMIHVTTQVATLMYATRLVEREGNVLITAMGTIVVPGAGYDGSSPEGDIDETGATAWAYVTSTVYVKQSPVEFRGLEAREGVNRANNTWSLIAEENAAAFFDPCCKIGINVNVRVRG